MTYSIIQKSQLEGTYRLDAEYYQPEYFIDFSKGDWRPIGSFLELCQYGISKAMNDGSLGYPIFKMDDISDTFLQDDKIRFSEISPTIFEQFKLNKNDILFNRVNAEDFVGRTGIFKLNGNYTFASYLIRLTTKSGGEILPDYLNIFLNSSYGIKQIKRVRRRAVNQANINAEELKLLKIFIFPLKFQEQIKALSEEAWKQISESKKLYSQAENLLLEELGLKDFKAEDDLFSVVSLEEIKMAERIDAEYFQQKYQKLINQISKYKNAKLEKIIDNIPAKFNPLIKPNDKFRYVELSNIDSSIGLITGYSEILGKEAPNRAKRILDSRDVIVSSIEGSLEKVALVQENQKSYLASTGFFQFRSKDILPEVLLILSRSIIFQWQFKQRTTGTILTAVTKESIKDILIPILPIQTQQKIADLVQKSHEARKKSKELLEEAKQKVEQMIEKSI